MTLVALKCPFCGSEHVGNKEFNNDKQRYKCKNSACFHQTFYAEYTYKACKPEVKSSILKLSVPLRTESCPERTLTARESALPVLAAQNRIFLTTLTTVTPTEESKTFSLVFLIHKAYRDEINRGAISGFHWRESMRRTISVIVCVIVAVFCAGLTAQIPENPRFQPGSYAVPYYYRPVHPPVATHASPTADAVSKSGDKTDDSTTEWEKRFSPQIVEPMVTQPLPPPYEVPHLTFTYNHWTGRFHITPYEPGYATNPAAFPRQTSPLHIWVSSKSSASQPNPQVPYMSYYDPDPVILPAEIRLYGTKVLASLSQTHLQPMPLPVPRPETAVPLYPPRTRLGERIRQTLGDFIVQ